uniref:Tick transposon n=1 Tax=Heterorhabditis bacteriophora TaxID=37862 RepID=A0A1I7XEJ7_HETBA
MKVIESQLGMKALGCTFHYKKCISQRRNEVGFRSKAASDALVSTYFRNVFPCHAYLMVGRRRPLLTTSGLITEARCTHLMGSSISSPDEQVLHLMDMLKYCCSEMTISKFDDIHCKQHDGATVHPSGRTTAS